LFSKSALVKFAADPLDTVSLAGQGVADDGADGLDAGIGAVGIASGHAELRDHPDR
jgi:hypothetical protein